ncbi:hypothetical protein IRT45_35205 [Nocardia sp. BSTN01]|uniref:hypothetical protein n=1 Tax=Nocardia sp. BSTN01 TaxID=2783665 RepID=UPI0018904F55|nr:hypothetical protein [Nocardia sp. BSTN01]MBF5002367.1 hypothetical protein [Nocardia sp. BSTN01]
MTRRWVSDNDRNWVMVCDRSGCSTHSEPFPQQPPLDMFQERGWFIAKLFGDLCPTCLEQGARPKPGWAGAEPYRGVLPPVMAEGAAR